MLPLVFLIGLAEEICNQENPRRAFWKRHLQIPDLADYVLFEVQQVSSMQTKLSEQAQADKENRLIKDQELGIKSNETETEDAEEDEL